MTDIEKQELLGCPHCHRSVVEAVLVDISNRWQIYCGACGSSSGSYKTEDEAIEGWNRRATFKDVEYLGKLRREMTEYKFNKGAELLSARERINYLQANEEEQSEILGEMNALALMLLREKYPEYTNLELRTKMFSEISRALKDISPTDEFYSTRSA